MTLTLWMACTLGACGWRLGPLAAPAEALSAGEVRVHGAEPGLEAALDEVLHAALPASGGAPVAVEVLSVGSRPVSPGGELQELRLRLRLSAPGLGDLELEGAEPFALAAGDPLATERARDAAARALGARLIQEGLVRLGAGEGG